MTKQTEALKMAIEAMECAKEVDWELNSLHVLNILQAIQACKEALVQPAQSEYMVNEGGTGTVLRKPAQESVAWLSAESKTNEIIKTHPTPSWQGNKEFVGLSDDEITKILHHPDGNLTIRGFARAIEQALKEKNT